MKILKSAWKILILIILIAFGLLYYASNRVDDKYQAAIKAMNEGQWSKGVSLILETPHYKEASLLYIYMYPHKLFYSGYTTESDAIKGYGNAAEFIKMEGDKLKGTTSEKYISELQELEKVLNFKVKALNAKLLDEPVKRNLDESVDLIVKGNYEGALVKLKNISNNSVYGIDKQELEKYIALQKIIPGNDPEAIEAAISELNPNYSGTLAQEIKLGVQTYVDIARWNELYNARLEEGMNMEEEEKTREPQEVVQQAQVNKSKSITVGMKREEVIAVLGNPSSGSKISNKYGNYEEMIYDNSKFVYLEDNIVTVIK